MWRGSVVLRHSRGIIAAAWSPSGDHIASVGADRYLMIYSLREDKVRSFVIDPSIIPTCMCWSPSPSLLAVGMENFNINIWDIERGKIIRRLLGHSAYINCVSWHRYLASGDKNKTIMIWDTDSGECISTLHGHRGEILDVDWAPDGGYIVSGGSDRKIIVWRLEDGRPIVKLSGHMDAIVSVAFNNDGKLIASCGRDRILRIWRFGTWRPIKTVRLETIPHKIGWSPDGKEIVIAYDDGRIAIYDLQTSKIDSFKAHDGKTTTVQWSPDGRNILSGGEDGLVKLWEQQT